MNCLSLYDIHKKISSYDPRIKQKLNTKERREWKELQEFIWCKSFVDFLKQEFNLQYDLICKNSKLESEGKDVFLHSNNTSLMDIHVQLTHANEYDMQPEDRISIKRIDISGNCIANAVIHKCQHYCDRRLDTKDLILLVQGTNKSTKLDDLMRDVAFLRIFQTTPCFKGIYYITENQVFVLKAAQF